MRLVDQAGDALTIEPSDSGGFMVLRVHEEADQVDPEANASFGLLPEEAMAVGVLLIRWAREHE